MPKEKRFETVFSQGTMDIIRIIQDTLTGVMYLQVQNGYAGGLTPLLDKDGKPMVWPLADLEEIKR